MIRARRLSAALALACLAGAVAWARPKPADVDWPLRGRTPQGENYSPLAQIDRSTVARLGLAWSFELQTDRGQEATPILAGGVLYTVSAYDVVFAIDARSGRQLWRYDPQVRAASAHSCCGPVSRGVAVADGRVFLGALDGRLIALDTRDGHVLWQAQTLDQASPPAENYSITGTPVVAHGRVVIGNGGAEFGARGFVTAYDAATGAKAWRFYTVPGKPGEIDGAASDAALAKALPTWAGQWWKWGGGGTVWDAIVYDPELDLLYIGTGNGSPWNQQLRSEGKGDNLFLSSIVALRPDTGAYVWHYQETPGETWDYTATQNIILADLPIGGTTRKVLMQAPKNGFFYVLDRRTGKLISADPYVPVNWAKGVDPVSGRPIEVPEARYYRTGQPHFQRPSSGGGHNWPPMAMSPRTGLVYIPAQDVGMPYAADADRPIVTGVYNSGVAITGGPGMSVAQRQAAFAGMKGYLIAWDPVARREAWRRALAAPFDGGVLATGGGLVFQGNAERRLVAYDDRDGRPLWSFDAGTGISAPPITYSVDGVQYVAVMAGWGGGWPLTGGDMALQAGRAVGPNRLLVFRLGGTATLPQAPPVRIARLAPPPATASPAEVAAGDLLYGHNCLRCHGGGAVSAGAYPDLRHTAFLKGPGFDAIVLHGALASQGMPSFAGKLTPAETNAIRAYLIARANEDRAQAPAE